jgi:hypothetical protein
VQRLKITTTAPSLPVLLYVTKRENPALTLSNPIFLPTAYSLAFISFRRLRGWWITCNYPRVLKEKKHRGTEIVQPALSVG